MADLREIHAAHNRYQDAMVQAFETHLRVIAMRAQGQALAQLQARLSITDGVIDQTPANLRTIRNLNNLFMEEMGRAGFSQLLESFVSQFPGQLPFLQQVLDYLSRQTDREIPVLDRPLEWTGRDRDLFGSLQANTVSALETALEISAGTAMQRGMLAVGGVKFADLVAALAEKFETGVSRARTLADTSMSTFYRTATDRALQQVQQGQKEEIRYRYSGPEDKLTRPFCEHLLMLDRGYTREQIAGMDNGQLPNVFLTGGGWNCRHSWILDVRALEARAAAAA